MKHAVISVGMESDEEGNPLVLADGKPLGTVKWLLRLLEEFELARARREAVPTPPHMLVPAED